MNVLAASRVIGLLFILIVTGCGEENPPVTTEADNTMVFMDEMTSASELPTVLGEGLTPDQKEEMMKQILPAGAGDEVTRGDKFQKLLARARAGEAKSQNELGVMYYSGEAVSKNVTGQVMDTDPGLAAGWFYRASEQGYADAQFNLGLLYASGEGVDLDLAKAVELFYKAAKQGNIDAQNNLGSMYYTGEGVVRDESEAAKWFEKAAAQGSVDAQANLQAIRSANR